MPDNYTRILGLQRSRDIDLADILRHELSPLPSSIFIEDGKLRVADGKSYLFTINSKFQSWNDIFTSLERSFWMALQFSGMCTCHVRLVKDIVDNFASHALHITQSSDVYLVFNRCFEHSTKSGTRKGIALSAIQAVYSLGKLGCVDTYM